MREVKSYSGIQILIILLVVTCVAYGSSSLLLFILESRLGPEKPPLSIPTARAKRELPAKLPVSHYRILWEKDIFSTYKDSQEDGGPLRFEELSLTSLNCSLIGTVAEEDGDGWAIIRDNDDNRQWMVTSGSHVKGARVVRIFRDKVVLNLNGKDELLLMDLEERPVQASASPAAGASSGGEILTYNVRRDVVEQSLSDLASVMSEVRVEPYFSGGKPDGFRVSQIQPGSLLTSMGFRNGDIVQSVNGRPITTAEDAMRLYGAMKGSTSFQVGMIRNNRPTTIRIRVL